MRNTLLVEAPDTTSVRTNGATLEKPAIMAAKTKAGVQTGDSNDFVNT